MILCQKQIISKYLLFDPAFKHKLAIITIFWPISKGDS